VGLKKPGREVNNPPPFSAKFKNKWSYTYASPSRVFVAWAGTTPE